MLPPDTHAEVVSSAILVPAIAVAVMSLLEGVMDSFEWRQRIAKLGWDLCVLAMGVVGGIFSNASVLGMFSNTPKLVGTVEALALLVSLAFAIVIMYMRRDASKMSGRRALIALALGGAALAIPSYLASTF